MRHLFYIHSHTTFLTALGTVSFLNLKNEDVVFVYSRNYKNTIIPITFAQVDFSDLFASSMKRGEEFFFWKLNKLVEQVDHKLSTVINNDYVAYLPHVGVFLLQAIATNEHCKGIKFIEEGIGCYSSSIGLNKLTFRESLKKLFTYFTSGFRRYWFTDNMFNVSTLKKEYRNHVETFGISAETFSALPHKSNIITWPSIDVEVHIDTDFPVFIFDAAIEQKFASKEAYLSNTKLIIEKFAKHKNFVKFHPAQSEDNKRIIKDYFFVNNFVLIELPGNIPFELILLQVNKFNIIGFGSSLLYYAKRLGHSVISCEYLLMKDPKYIRYKKLIDFRID
ncbi:polysialyltransferase family glycosyltransferase [Flectobacillus rivi]|uniref:Polysialyltransferase family glycosyltransferase n=1 Tax=Flectobacillus rivi TaxID=2984209 RepID=A0ABT6YX18_9BACT|nr:polysialyltransferase family glycosyltransferase [Flectobacillus rivi]MDI9873359.1 polysialyltransferase family glycosyltransferase [Flectobacillus rivi]